MPDPWEPLPLPLRADADKAVLFEALGRTLDRWEYIEYSLSVLYSLFAGGITHERYKEYGNGITFSHRLAALERAAASWFVKCCDQNAEGEFSRIVTAARGFSDRRNEFAHGLVVNVNRIIVLRLRLRLSSGDGPMYLVIPPIHVWRKHNEIGMPMFGYSSYELNMLATRLRHFQAEIYLFQLRLFPRGMRDWLQPPEERL
jgi:hypothetical protein